MGLFKPNVEELKKKKDVKALIKALQYKKDWEVRRDAAKALGEIGDKRAVKPLIKALGDIDVIYVKKEGLAIIDLGDEVRSEPYVANIVRNNRGQYVRESAAKALGEIGDAKSVDSLIWSLKNTNSGVRQCAAWALGNVGDKRAIEPLIQVLKDKDSGVRWGASEALGKIGKPAVEHLIQALKHKDRDFRERVVYTLGKIGDERAVENLKQALKDEDEIVRGAAKKALKIIKSKRN